MKKEIKLAQVLQREMKVRGVSITQLSRSCKIPRTTLSDWSNGIAPSAKTLHHVMSLAEYFELSLSELLFSIKETSKIDDQILFTSSFVDGNNRYRLIIEKIKQ